MRKVLISFLIISLAGGFLCGFLGGFYSLKILQPQSLPPSQKETSGLESLSYEEKIVKVVKASENSVVSVIASKDLPVLEKYYINPFEEFPDFFPFGFEFQIPQYRQKGTQKQEVSSGSGFIVDSRGYIITNRHVVSDESAEYTVLTNDGKKYPAKVIARDPVEDFAVLKIEANNLTPLKLGDSKKIEIGESVIVIGNALGEFRNTVSVGVISGLYRTIQAADSFGNIQTLNDVIQTDAAINRGNSGGPVLNLKGEVVGMSTAMVSGAQNIGFAIPINKIKSALSQVIETGKIKIPFLGVRYVLVDNQIQEEKNLKYDYGALIVKGDKEEEAIVKNSPADKAGLKEGDVILEIDGKKINKENNLANLIREYKVGDTITLKINRGEKIFEVKVTLTERKEKYQ
ncbi:MAG: S1C family serine protease [Minisyncoccia bacterium]